MENITARYDIRDAKPINDDYSALPAEQQDQVRELLAGHVSTTIDYTRGLVVPLPNNTEE